MISEIIGEGDVPPPPPPTGYDGMERRRDEGESFRNIAELKENKGRGGARNRLMACVKEDLNIINELTVDMTKDRKG